MQVCPLMWLLRHWSQQLKLVRKDSNTISCVPFGACVRWRFIFRSCKFPKGCIFYCKENQKNLLWLTGILTIHLKFAINVIYRNEGNMCIMANRQKKAFRALEAFRWRLFEHQAYLFFGWQDAWDLTRKEKVGVCCYHLGMNTDEYILSR